MTKTITAHEATVKTATVDVKALTISGRQVTLSVFRQLKNEPILDEDTVTLRGVPWGIVNYFWGECAKETEHLHVVWQKAEELRRACVFPSPSFASGWVALNTRACDVSELFIMALVATMADEAPIEVQDVGYSMKSMSVWVNDRWFTLRINSGFEGWVEITNLLSISKQRRNVYRSFDGEYRGETDEEMEERVANLIQGWATELWGIVRRRSGTSSLELIRQNLEEDVVALADFEIRWRDQYSALESLDHLFIAV